jgi:PAS domain S-box-containing protein
MQEDLKICLTHDQIRALIKESYKVLSFEMNWVKLLEITCRRVEKLIGGSYVVFVRDKYGNIEEIQSKGLKKENLDYLADHLLGNDLLKGIPSQKPMLFNNFINNFFLPPKFREIAASENLSSALFCSAEAGDDFGIIVAIFKDNPFNQNDSFILSLIADQLKETIKSQVLFSSLRAEKIKIENIHDSIEDGLILYDSKGLVLSYNQAAKKLLGFKKSIKGCLRDDIFGNKDNEFFENHLIFEKDLDQIFNRVLIFKKTEENVYRTIDPFGKIKVFQNRLTPYIKNDEVVAVISNFRDITEIERQKELALKEKKKWQDIFEHTPDGVLLINKDTSSILAANPAFERIFGYNEDDLVGKNVHYYLSAERHEAGKCINCPIVKALSLSKKGEIFECNLKRSDGEIFWAGITVATIEAEITTQQLYIVIIRDITRIKEIEQSKRDFTSIVSHELRTPLSAMKGYLSMMINGDLGTLSEKQKNSLNKIYQSTERMVGLVEDILMLNRIDTNRLIFIPAGVNLKSVVKEVIGDLTIKSLSKQIIIKLEIPARLPKVWFDPDRLRQVFFNLIDNAIKYSYPESQVLVSIKREEDFVLVSIEDDGVGIQENQRHKLFEKFGRIHNDLSVKAGGTGLGLYISKNLIESGGGEIWFESKKKGSKFIFKIPIKK